MLLMAMLAGIAHTDQADDWLVSTTSTPATTPYVAESCWPEYDHYPVQCGVEIGNGLVVRRFVTTPAFGTIDYIVNATPRFGGASVSEQLVVGVLGLVQGGERQAQ